MLEHFKGDEAFVSRILDDIALVEMKQTMVTTNFLNPHQQNIIRRIIGNNPNLKMLFYGGYENSENKKCIIAPDYFEINEDDFKIIQMKIKYNSKYTKLTHPDVLGTLMAQGLKREYYGDIVAFEGDFYFFIDQSIENYLIHHLKKIKNATIHLEQSVLEIQNNQEYIMNSFIVSSMRLDKIVASIYKLTRSKAADYIRGGYVKVNHKIVDEIAYLCNNEDIISLKRHGRVKLVDTTRKTKSDNYVVEGYFYK